jgi:choline dehydrogenase
MYPRARGSTHIRSADPLQSSLVHPNYLGSEVDRRTLVAGLRIVHSLARSAPLSKVITREIRPGHANPGDDDLLHYAMGTAETCWHPVGTCRMGSDAAAVVDPDCRVNEVERLRVVDGSVFPFIPASNTNIPVVMLAEKMAERIAGSAR